MIYSPFLTKNFSTINLCILIIVCITLFGHTLHSIPTQVYNPLIIILDSNQEETVDKSLHQDPQAAERPQGIGALTYTLLTALEQRAAPIITSTTLIANILHHAKIYTDFALRNSGYLTDKYQVFTRFFRPSLVTTFQAHCSYSARSFKLVNQKLHTLPYTPTQTTSLGSALKTLVQDPLFGIHNAPPTLHKLFTHNTHNTNTDKAYYHELVSYVLCAHAATTLRQWVIKKISNELCLLVHPSLASTPEKLNTQAFTYTTSAKNFEKKFTALELSLNLQIHHLPTLELAQLHMPRTFTSKSNKKQSLTHYLTSIFAPGTAHWIIYLTGHGTPTSTAGFTHREFTQFLQALNNLGTIHTLCYGSCYAGGTCLTTTYQIRQRQLRLNFSVLAAALDQAPIKQAIPTLALPPYSSTLHDNTITIAGITPESIDRQKKCLRLTTSINFKQFFKTLSIPLSHCTEQLYRQSVNYISPYSTPSGYLDKSMLAQVGSLRKPHSTYFTLLLPAHGCCTLDNLFCARSPVLQKKALAQANTLVFATPDITCPVYFHKNRQLHSLVCITRDYTRYTLKALDAPEYTLPEILAALYPLEDHAQPPRFTIKTLTYKKNTRTYTLYNVKIMHQACITKHSSKKRTVQLTYTQDNIKKTEIVYLKRTKCTV